MAIQNLNKQDQLDLTMNWDGTTGQQVEDLISRHLPASMGYDSSSNVLTIANTNGDTIVQTEVSVAQPIYILYRQKEYILIILTPRIS